MIRMDLGVTLILGLGMLVPVTLTSGLGLGMTRIEHSSA